MFSEPSLSHLVPNSFVSLNSVLNTSEPSSYKQAKEDPRWVEAMKKKLDAREANQTWDLTPLSVGTHVIGLKWLFKTKFNPDGIVERCKGRLEARGDKQIKGKDFKHTFSLVAKFTTV